MRIRFFVYLVLAFAGVASAGHALAAGGFVSKSDGSDASSSGASGQG